MDWFPWYPHLYQADTMHLTCLQDGAYRRLIDHYMMTRQPLPDSDIALARIVGLGADEWAEIADIVRKFFKPRDGLLHHKKCNEELNIQDKTAKRRSKAAQHAAQKRWNSGEAEDTENADKSCGAHTERIDGACGADGLGMPQDKTRQDITKKQTTNRAASAPPKEYVFSGEVIRLTDADYRRWEESFPRLDLRAELTALDAYYATLPAKETKRWYPRCATALANKHRDAQPQQAASEDSW